MDRERWDRIQQLYESALERHPDKRAAYVEQACGGDEHLRRELNALLVQSDCTADVLGKGVWEAVVHAAEPTCLHAGVRLGCYEITGPLGEGGMGKVYRAVDARLGRAVAIKVSAEQFSARFMREAQAIAALNHPNVCTVYDVGSTFLVMELLEGETLAERLDRSGALPLPQAIDIAVQVAAALEAAHRSGIVHRDLKPANVMITNEGRLKVLDFGLATAPGRQEAQTVVPLRWAPCSDGASATGRFLGTPAYMSPEQARGEQVDTSADIWAYGCVLYELLAGKRAFSGYTTPETLAAIATQEPDWRALPFNTPPYLRKIIRECLQKDSARRLRDISAVLSALRTGSRRRRPLAIALAAAAAAAMCTVAAGWVLSNRASEPALGLQAVPLTTYVGNQDWPSFSPDGAEVAFSWDGESENNFDIYTKRIGAEPPRRLTQDPAVETNPAWSPDGQNIAFLRASAPGRLSVVLVPSRGGPERIIGDVSRVEVMNRCLTWSPDGLWVVVYDRPPSQPGGLWLLSLHTRVKRRLTTAGTEHAPVEKSPAFAPHGRVLAFARNAARNSFDLYLLPLRKDFTPSGDEKLLLRTNRVVGGLAWTAHGRELIFSSGVPGNINLFRMPVSGSAGPTRLTQHGEILALSFAPRANRLAYVQLRRELDIHRAELSRDGGGALRSMPLIASSRLDRFPRYSPDGKRIAFVSLRSGEWQLWVADENGRTPVQMTFFEQAEVASPTWSPDGRQIGFISNAEGPYEAYVVDAGGSKPRKIETGGKHLFGLTWSRNGRWFYFLSGTGGARQVWRVAVNGGTPQQLTRRGAYGDFAQSPDDKWLYYLGQAGVWRVPADGGEERELFRYDINPSPIETNARGIYFVQNSANATGSGMLMFFRFPKGPITAVDGIRTSYGFAASPDGRFLLYTAMRSGADLMMVPDFR